MSVQTAQYPAAAFQFVLAALTHLLGSPVFGAVVRAGIPDLLDTGAMRAQELARVTGLHLRSTTRVLRMLASFGVSLPENAAPRLQPAATWMKRRLSS